MKPKENDIELTVALFNKALLYFKSISWVCIVGTGVMLNIACVVQSVHWAIIANDAFYISLFAYFLITAQRKIAIINHEQDETRLDINLNKKKLRIINKYFKFFGFAYLGFCMTDLILSDILWNFFKIDVTQQTSTWVCVMIAANYYVTFKKTKKTIEAD